MNATEISDRLLIILKRIRLETECGADRITNEGILSQTEDGVPIRKLFISNIAERSSYKDLSKLFSKYGKIENCYLKRNPNKSNYAFITFSTVEEAIEARRDGSIKEINLHDRDLRVMPANSWHQPDSVQNRMYICGKDWNKSHKEFSLEVNNGDYMENYSDSPINSLTDDCLIHIFHYLPIMNKVSIERVCKRWRAISRGSWSTFKKLDLYYHTWGTYKYFKVMCTPNLCKVLRRCGRFLTHLDFSQYCQSLNRTTLLLISKFCPNLQIIDITSLHVNGSGIESLAQNCKNIKKLSLGDTFYRWITYDKELTELFEANKSLQYLNLHKSEISGRCLLSFPSDALEELVFDYNGGIIPSHVAGGLAGLKNLKSLTMNMFVPCNDRVMEAIGNCTNLEILNMQRFVIVVRDAGLETLGLVKLRILRLPKSTFVKDMFLINLASTCKELTYLDISDCDDVTDTGLEAITTLPKLETLLINRLRKVTAIGLNNMYNIKHLECKQCKRINDTGLALFFYGSTNLKYLDLSGCIGVTNATVDVAVDATSSRSNDVMLIIYVGGTSIIYNEIHRNSPYLIILDLYLS